MYAAECSPALIRGGLVMSWQLWVSYPPSSSVMSPYRYLCQSTFGALLGFAANLILYQVGDIAWRLQLGSAFLPALPLIFLVFLCPESPRWLMKQNRYHDAFNSFKRLRGSELKAARDLYYAHSQLTEELESMKCTFPALPGSFLRLIYDQISLDILYSFLRTVHGSPHQAWNTRQLHCDPHTANVGHLSSLRVSLTFFCITLFRLRCGIIIIYFYSATIFVEAGYSIKAALLASFGFGLINWIFSFPAIWVINFILSRPVLEILTSPCILTDD